MPPGIPLSADELSTYTPPSLANLVTAPVFRFRPVTERDGRAFEGELFVNGLRRHDVDAFRAEYEIGIKALFSESEADAAIGQLREIWDANDQSVDIAPNVVAAAQGLLARVTEKHVPLLRMERDNNFFFRDVGKIALGMFLVGWSGLETPFKRVEGAVPLETADALERELVKIERQAKADSVEGVDPGAAFLQLSTHALELMNLTRGEEGNSPSLSPSPSIQNGSETGGPETANGSSPAKPTPKTPRRGSRKPTGN